jgi:hypothetical protein
MRVTYNAVELGSFVALRSARRVLRLACAELTEVLSRLRDNVGEEFEGDTAEWLAWNMRQPTESNMMYSGMSCPDG